jgi:hypothetical protein
LIVAIRVTQPIKAFGIIRVGIEGTVSEEQAATFQQIGIDGFDAHGGSGIRGQRQPQQSTIFARDHRPPFGIKRQRDPGTLTRLGRTHQLHPKARRRLDGPGGGGDVCAEGVLPLVVVFADKNLSTANHRRDEKKDGQQSRP